MKKIIYIFTLIIFSLPLSSQQSVSDTTRLKALSSLNNGKIVTIDQGGYQGTYYATNTEQTPNHTTIFASSEKAGWYWVKVRETVLLDATRWGLPNDGTTISEERFTSFLARTNGSSVYFPAGTYDISGFSLAEVVADISWYGEGRNTIIEGMNNFKLAGNVDINNMSFKDGEIMFRQDAFTSTSYTKNHFIVRNVYMQNCGHLVRNVLDGSNVVYYDEVIIDNVIQDTINSSGGGKAFIQWTTPAQHVSVTNILIQYNTDSSYITPIRFLGANNGLIPTTDTTMYFDNITFKNLVINATNAPAPVTNILLMAVGGEGADIIANNIHAYECNLPQFDFRGTGSEITLDGWDIYCPDVVSTAAWSDYFIINKSVAYDANDWAFIMRNSDVEIGTNSGEISGVYFESDGDKLISNTRLSVQAGAGSVVRARTNATPTHYNKLRLENSSIIHNGSSGRFAFRILDDISIIEIDGCYVDGPNSSIGESVTSDTTEILRVTNSTFHGGFQGATQRQIKQAVFLNNDFVGNDNYNFSALEKVFMSGNVFRDDTITDPNKDVDINFEFGAAKYVVFSNNFFDLKRTRRMGTLDHEFNADGLDTLIYNNNTGTVITSLSTCIPVRVDSVVYLEMKDNNIYFGGAADAAEAYPLRVLNSIDNAVIDGNNFHLQGGLPTNFFVEGLAGAFIRSLKLGDNETFTTFAEGDVTISAYADIVVHNAIDKDGNAYLTSATGYTQAQLYTKTELNDTLAFYQLRPEEVQVGTSRNFLSSDVEQIVRCTDTITLTIPLNFSAMAAEQTITVLKAFAGTSITITGATGVTVNGSSGGSATITGDYKAGIIYKVSTNTYEVY